MTIGRPVWRDVSPDERTPPPAQGVRIGDSQVVRGGARVELSIEEPATDGGLGPSAEAASASLPRLSDREVAEAGLLRERVIEFGEMREEAVVSKEAVVREELVVSKTAEERVEHIEETVRHTEVEVEELPARADEWSDAKGAAEF